MNKTYGARLRLTPEEVDVVYKYRDGKVNLQEPLEPRGRLPKILIFDIETSLLSAFIFRLKNKGYISPKMLERDIWYMISWSAKWLFDDEILNDVVTSKEAIDEDDSRIAKSIWRLIEEADIVIAHNGKNFDQKFLNMRWLMNGLEPPVPAKMIDTYHVARSVFDFPSNGLDYIATILGIGSKKDHEGNDLWKKCMVGDEEALEIMQEYNDQDVKILEDVYLLFRPWIKGHPNIGLFLENEKPVCHACASDELIETGKKYITGVSKFATLRCSNCGAINRKRTTEVPKEIRKKLIAGIPGTY